MYISRNGGNADCYTGWANQDYMEVWEPTKNEQAMISYSQAMNTDNGADDGNVRSFSFNKQSDTSVLRLLYYDNLRVIGHGKWCRWDMRVNGKSCRIPIAGSIYTYQSDNDHYPHMLWVSALVMARVHSKSISTFPGIAVLIVTPGGHLARRQCILSLKSKKRVVSSLAVP